MHRELLSRTEFREGVYARDQRLCVNCQEKAVDAHHIIERRLFPDGGYYLDNGASVCGDCHLLAEQTVLSCDRLRALCGIQRIILPPHLYADQQYDKWGNPILENGLRVKGELFDDLSVQKVLQPVLHLFTNRIKYPRTHHLPWSGQINNDDRVMENGTLGFQNKRIVVTVKMDGEQTSMYNDGLHARSLTMESHPSRSWVKAIHAQISHDIPEGWRVCGQNL